MREFFTGSQTLIHTPSGAQEQKLEKLKMNENLVDTDGRFERQSLFHQHINTDSPNS